MTLTDWRDTGGVVGIGMEWWREAVSIYYALYNKDQSTCVSSLWRSQIEIQLFDVTIGEWEIYPAESDLALTFKQRNFLVKD